MAIEKSLVKEIDSLGNEMKSTKVYGNELFVDMYDSVVSQIVFSKKDLFENEKLIKEFLIDIENLSRLKIDPNQTFKAKAIAKRIKDGKRKPPTKPHEQRVTYTSVRTFFNFNCESNFLTFEYSIGILPYTKDGRGNRIQKFFKDESKDIPGLVLKENDRVKKQWKWSYQLKDCFNPLSQPSTKPKGGVKELKLFEEFNIEILILPKGGIIVEMLGAKFFGDK